ncbi:MAG: hypothetical protein Q3983_01845 [Capnocytophaga sp.]|nr:hypothetical protein [Capnocytophaga sp.]
MKKYFFFFLLSIVAVACSKDSSSSGHSSSSASMGGSLSSFIIKGDYLYTTDNQRLNVFNIKNETNPIQVNYITIGFDIETLYSLGQYLFIGAQDGMYIYSVENPETPKRLSKSTHFRSCDPVVATETHAFVTLHSSTSCNGNVNELQIYDITDPKKPKLLSKRGLTHPRGLAISPDKNYLLVCDDALKVFSIENPEDTKLVSSLDKNYKDLIFYKNKLFAFGEREITQYQWSSTDFSDLTEISSVKF